jgi:hypothetical protein
MALDPNISLGVRGIELANPLAQYGQVAQLQSAQMQNQVSQMQLEQMRRDEATLQQIQAKATEHGGPSDLNEIADAYIKSGNPKFVEFGVGLRQKLDDRTQFMNIMGMGNKPAPAPAGMPSEAGAAAPAPTNALAPAPATTNALVSTAPPAPSVNALAPPAPGAPDVAMLRRQRDQLLALGTTQSIAAAKALDADIALASKEVVYHNVPGVGLVDPRTGRVIVESKESTQPEIKQYEYAKAQGYKGSLFDFKREMANAGRTPAQPSAPVAVVDPVTGKQVYVSRERAMGMTPAAAMESLPPKEIQKREAALPQATSAIKGFETKSDSFVSDLEKLRDHPGLSQITGIVAGRIPAVTSEGRAAQALYDKVVAKGGFQALQDLRDATKTGGALGNISNQEGSQLKASFAAIDRRQEAKDVKAAIDEAIGNVQGAKTRMREAYDATYQYKSGKPAEGGGVIDFGSLK